nr:hypothetical protein [Tanacetum cinerariifolium]
AEYQAWTTTDVRLRPSISLTPADLEMDEDMAPDEQAQLSDEEDIESAHIPTVNLRQDWWKPFEEERPATPEPAWSIRSSDMPVPTNNWTSSLASNYSPPPEDSLLAQTGPAYEIVKVFHSDVIHLQYQMEECHKLLTDSVDDPILRHNVSKPLPLGGPPVRTHMRILSVVRIAVFSMYRYDYMKKIVLRCADLNEHVIAERDFKYDYMKKIVLRCADLNEHVIAERDFKYLYPSDFKDLYMLNLQGHLNHLPPKDKKILTTADATGFEYKHDYTVIDSPRAFILRDKYGVQMMMRFNEIHKFSDDTLQKIDEALDYRVKEFKINSMNPSFNTRFWTRNDVDRCKAFMFAIQRRSRTRRIFRNLESF